MILEVYCVLCDVNRMFLSCTSLTDIKGVNKTILAGRKYELVWKEMKMDRFTGLYPIKTRKTSFSILALTCHEGHRANVFIIIIIISVCTGSKWF